MRGAGGYGRDASRLAAAKRRLLRAAALGALASSGALTGMDAARGQVAATLPEVTVAAPRPAPVRRAAPAAKPARAARPARVAAPAPSPASAPTPASQIPAFQVVATTPVTGPGSARDRAPPLLQPLPAEASSRAYPPTWSRRSCSAFPASPL